MNAPPQAVPVPAVQLALPAGEPGLLPVTSAVQQAQVEMLLAGGMLGSGAGSFALQSEASALLSDAGLFAGAITTPSLVPQTSRDQPIRFAPALHVMHAVRYQPVTDQPGLFVQNVARQSAMEASLRDAAVNQMNSATPGYALLFDPFSVEQLSFVPEAPQILANTSVERLDSPSSRAPGASDVASSPGDRAFSARHSLVDVSPAVPAPSNAQHHEMVNIRQAATHPHGSPAAGARQPGERLQAQLQREAFARNSSRPLTRSAATL